MVVAVAGATAAPAAASTVRVDQVEDLEDDFRGVDRFDELIYTAEGQERNALRVRRGATSGGQAQLIVDDPGAVIQPGEGCVRGSGVRQAICTVGATSGVQVSVQASLGARDDSASLVELGFSDSSNRLDGGDGRDLLIGGPGVDVLDGHDVALEGDDADSLLGGRKNDVLRGGGGNDTLDGGTGRDEADYSFRTTPVHVDLSQPDGPAGSGAERDLLRSIEDVHGGERDDVLIGNGARNRLLGEGGRDRLDGAAGNDRLAGGSGRDRLAGRSGRDRLEGQGAGDRVSGGSGNDRLLGGPGGDRLRGQGGRDRLRGEAGNDRLAGGSGGDRLLGGSGNDRLSGNSGNDRVNSLDRRYDTVRCGGGRDRVKVDRIDVFARSCESVLVAN